MNIGILFSILFLLCSFFVAGQMSSDTVVIFDYYEKGQLAAKLRHSTGGLLIIVRQDSFFLNARKAGRRMRLNNPIRFLESVRARKNRNFHISSRFSGIRVIVGREQSDSVRVQSVKATGGAKWDNESFDTLLTQSNFKRTHQMLWNIYYHSGPAVEPRRFVEKYQLHAVNLPQLTELKKGRNKKIKRIEKTLLYEVNLVTGVVINYKTGEKRILRPAGQ